MEASHAREIADDIFKLARDGYISYVDITLLQYGVEKRAVRYTVMESGSDLAGSRPGGVVWERLPAAELRVVIDRTSKWNALPQGERDGIARSLKRHWGLIYDDLSPCQPAFPVVVVTSPATIMPSRERTSANGLLPISPTSLIVKPLCLMTIF